MGRPKREFKPGYSYHITTRCNNRDFNLTRRETREILLHIIKKAKEKYPFKLYALCIMLNHVHYLIEAENPDDIPKIIHWINWYSAMSFNALLNRKGHFWEQRYSCHGFPSSDKERALNTIRYIHANPKAAGMREGFFYDFSNYGTYEQLTTDGITQWHPAFFELGASLEECADKYKGFCRRYKPRKKRGTLSSWGKKILRGILSKLPKTKVSPGQIPLPFLIEKIVLIEIPAIAESAIHFIKANRLTYNYQLDRRW